METLIVYQANSYYSLIKSPLPQLYFLSVFRKGYLKTVCKKFAKFIAKHLRQSFFLINLQVSSKESGIGVPLMNFFSRHLQATALVHCYLRYKYAMLTNIQTYFDCSCYWLPAFWCYVYENLINPFNKCLFHLNSQVLSLHHQTC